MWEAQVGGHFWATGGKAQPKPIPGCFPGWCPARSPPLAFCSLAAPLALPWPFPHQPPSPGTFLPFGTITPHSLWTSVPVTICSHSAASCSPFQCVSSLGSLLVCFVSGTGAAPACFGGEGRRPLQSPFLSLKLRRHPPLGTSCCLPQSILPALDSSFLWHQGTKCPPQGTLTLLDMNLSPLNFNAFFFLNRNLSEMFHVLPFKKSCPATPAPESPPKAMPASPGGGCVWFVPTRTMALAVGQL